MSTEGKEMVKQDQGKALDKVWEVVHQMYAMEATPTEFFIFRGICTNYDLSPSLGEIYFSKIQGKPTIMIGTRAFKKQAMRDPKYNRLLSGVVFEGDEFSYDPVAGTMQMKKCLKLKERGEIIGAWAMLDLKGIKPIIDFADMQEYNKPNSDSWKKYPQTMIKTKAERLVLMTRYHIGIDPAFHVEQGGGETEDPDETIVNGESRVIEDEKPEAKEEKKPENLRKPKTAKKNGLHPIIKLARQLEYDKNDYAEMKKLIKEKTGKDMLAHCTPEEEDEIEGVLIALLEKKGKTKDPDPSVGSEDICSACGNLLTPDEKELSLFHFQKPYCTFCVPKQAAAK